MLRETVGSSEDRLVVFWLSSRANNVKGGRRNTSTRTVEPDAPAGGGNQHNMHAAHACIPYHEICNSILLRVTRAPVASPVASPHRSASRVPILVAAPPRLSCPTLLRPVLSRIGDSEPALGRLSGLFIHNHPLSVMHREDASVGSTPQ